MSIVRKKKKIQNEYENSSTRDIVCHINTTWISFIISIRIKQKIVRERKKNVVVEEKHVRDLSHECSELIWRDMSAS